MKRLLGIVAVLALASAASVANAADNAWFSLQGSTGTCDIIGSPVQGPGQALTINHGAGKLNDCVLTIGYNFTSEGGAMAGWAFKLNQPSGAPAGTYVAGNGTHVGSGYNTPVSAADGNLINVGNVSTGGTGSAGLVFTFTLATPTGKPAGTHNITGDFGPSTQSYSSGFLWYGRVAGGPISYGAENYQGSVDNTPGWGPQPVIVLTNVPEPATLSLLAFGALALIRRRK